MSTEPSVPLWMLTTALGALSALLGIGIYALVAHFKADQQRAERLAVAESEIKSLKAEIGDHNSGIRGWLHKLASDWSPYLIRRQQEERDK